MTSPSSSSRVANPRGALLRAAGTLVGVVLPYLVAVLVWIVAAPRAELLSVGNGRGIPLVDSGVDSGSQLLILVILFIFATVCAALVLWHRHPWLRRPGGVAVLALVPELACSMAAANASRMSGLLASPPPDAPYGVVVAQAPAVGALFFDRLIYGQSGPSWDWLPPGAGWLALGAMIAAFTAASLAYFSDSPGPVAEAAAEDPGLAA